jgi:hypothetical protein
LVLRWVHRHVHGYAIVIDEGRIQNRRRGTGADQPGDTAQAVPERFHGQTRIGAIPHKLELRDRVKIAVYSYENCIGCQAESAHGHLNVVLITLPE